MLDTPTKDRSLGGQVDQVVKQFGGHLDHVGARFGGQRRRLRLVLRQAVERYRGNRPLDRRRVTEGLDSLDQALGRRYRLTGAGGVEHLRQSVMAALQQPEQRCRRFQRTGGQTFVEKFQFMGEVADRADFHHPCTALEGVQVAQQGFDFLAVLRVGLPAHQGRAGTVDDVEAFLEEDFQQLRIIARPIVGRCLCSDFGVADATLAPLRDGRDQGRAIAQRLLALQLFEQLGEAVVALLQQLAQLGAVAQAPVHQPLVKAFQLMGQVTYRSDLGHPRPTLEGVQVPLQRQQRRRVLRLREPTLQGLPSALQDVDGLFEKDRRHFIVRRQRRQ